jgi:hypothetical protein
MISARVCRFEQARLHDDRARPWLRAETRCLEVPVSTTACQIARRIPWE